VNAFKLASTVFHYYAFLVSAVKYLIYPFFWVKSWIIYIHILVGYIEVMYSKIEMVSSYSVKRIK